MVETAVCGKRRGGKRRVWKTPCVENAAVENAVWKTPCGKRRVWNGPVTLFDTMLKTVVENLENGRHIISHETKVFK